MKCGDANPNGNISLFYKGGCKQEVDTSEAYRCTGCGGSFHKECALEHFKLEKEHDFGRNELKKEINDWVVANHCHHEGEQCDYYDYPFVNSMELIDFINNL
jgi:hypothetical protein